MSRATNNTDRQGAEGEERAEEEGEGGVGAEGVFPSGRRASEGLSARVPTRRAERGGSLFRLATCTFLSARPQVGPQVFFHNNRRTLLQCHGSTWTYHPRKVGSVPVCKPNAPV